MMILAVFRSRAQAMDYYVRLTGYGIRAATLAAPKEAGIGCGLSVKFSVADRTRAFAVMKWIGYSSFKGFYRMSDDGRTVSFYRVER